MGATNLSASLTFLSICTCVDVRHVLCVRDLAEGVGLSIPIEVVSEPPAERQQHDLNGKTEGRSLGLSCGGRNRLGRGYTRGQSLLGYKVITARGKLKKPKTGAPAVFQTHIISVRIPLILLTQNLFLCHYPSLCMIWVIPF